MWFPNSEICGSKLICSSPQLIAACHVLLRLLMPRHSPYALLSLNFQLYQFSKNFLAFFAWVSQIIDWLLSSLLKRPYLLFSPCLTICSFCYPINGKTLFLNHCWSGIFRFHKIFLNYLFVSYFTWIRFSMNIFFHNRSDCVVGLSGLEPPTSRLSGARSNLLSYKPMW